MALWEKDTQPDLRLALAKAEVKNELYEEQIAGLHKQIERLQEALVASTSPKAYDQILADRVDTTPPDPRWAQKEEEDKVLREYLELVEGPTFKDGDDLISSLGASIGIHPGVDSLHSNSES